MRKLSQEGFEQKNIAKNVKQIAEKMPMLINGGKSSDNYN